MLFWFLVMVIGLAVEWYFIGGGDLDLEWLVPVGAVVAFVGMVKFLSLWWGH